MLHSYSGEEYDAIQTNLHMNHLALVDKARGGDKLRIGDQGNPDIISPAQPTEGGHMPIPICERS